MRFGLRSRRGLLTSFPILLMTGVLAVNLFVIAMVAFSLRHSREQYRLQAETNARNLCQVLEQNLDGTIGQIDLALLAVKGEAEREFVAGGIHGKALDAFIGQQSRVLAIDNFRIANARGEGIYGTGLAPGSKISFADRAYFRQLRDDPHAGLVASEPLVGRYVGKWMIVFARRINRPDGSFAGIAWATVTLGHFTRALSLVDVGKNGIVTLRGKDRTVLAHYPISEGASAQLGRTIVTPAFQRILNEGRSEGTYTAISSLDQVERTFSFRQTPGYLFFVVVGLATEDYLTEWRHEAAWLWGLAAVFFLFTFVAGGVIYRGWKYQVTAQEVSRESERFLRTIIDLVPHLIFVKDQDSRYLLVNRACAEAYGTTPAQMFGRCTTEIVSNPSRAEEFIKADQEVLDSGKAKFIAEEEIPDGSGGIRLHQTNKVPFISSTTGKKALIGVSVDITDHKRQEQALAESEDRLRTIVELAPDGIFVANEQGQILEVNETGCKQLGYTRDRLLQLTIFDIIAPQFAARAAARLRGEVPSGVYENAHVRADGTIVPTELSVTKIMFRKQPAFLRITRDITERKRAEEEKISLQNQLMQAQKLEAVGRLTGGVAHDFNNLLMVITSYTEMLQAELAPDDRLRRNTQQVLKAADRAGSLTKQLLAFSRKQVLLPEALDLNTVVDEVAKMLKRLIGEDVELRFLPTKPLSPVMADPTQMTQVLMNLAVNARDAMPKGGKLTIETRNVVVDAHTASRHPDISPGNYVMVAVSDTGTGMTKDVQEQIFEPFFTTKEKGKGTGLGLSTVYGIVKQSGGYIWVDSEPDHGTCFKLYFPKAERSLAAVAPLQFSNSAGRGETILLVEDEDSLRESVGDYLRKSGYEVLAASNGQQALEVADRQVGAIHLLLTDVIMPQMSGPELARELASRKEMNVLYMSGYTDDAIVNHSVLEPGVAFVQKPISLSELGVKVRSILDSHSSDGHQQGAIGLGQVTGENTAPAISPMPVDQGPSLAM